MLKTKHILSNIFPPMFIYIIAHIIRQSFPRLIFLTLYKKFNPYIKSLALSNFDILCNNHLLLKYITILCATYWLYNRFHKSLLSRTMKKTKSEIKISDIYHEVNGDEYIVIEYYYRGKTYALLHDVEAIKKGCKDEFATKYEGNKDWLSTIRKFS